MSIKFFSRKKYSRLVVVLSSVFLTILLGGCLLPTDFLVLEPGGWAPGTTNQLPQYKVFWPTPNVQFQMFCFKSGYQGSDPQATRSTGAWLYAFDNGLDPQDATQETAILNEVALQDSTGTLYTGKWGQNSTVHPNYAPQFERYISPSSYCWGPPKNYPGVSGCDGSHTCRKAELFAASSPDGVILPIFSADKMTNCVLAQGSTVAAWIQGAINCPKQRVLSVYLKFS